MEIEACEEETDIITPDTLLNLVTEFKIGGFGKEFFTEYLIENLEQLSDRRVSCNWNVFYYKLYINNKYTGIGFIYNITQNIVI